MRKTFLIAWMALVMVASSFAQGVEKEPYFPSVSESERAGWFPLSTTEGTPGIYTSTGDYRVVEIAANLFADDVERVTGRKPQAKSISRWKDLPRGAAIVAGTLGRSVLVDELVRSGLLDVGGIRGRWADVTPA